MSVPSATNPSDTSSLRTIRGLIERRLLDRAVAVSEARWPGSGQMVSLANDWAELSPADRRQRLAAIGPQDLARLRALADLQPDLARVLDDLETRGVLPSVEEMQTSTATREEFVADALADAGEAGLAAVTAQVVLPDPPANPTAYVPRAPLLPSQPLVPRAPMIQLEPLAQVEMPDLDLGLPSTDAFLEGEAQRRRQQADAAEVLLERVRARIESASQKLLAAPVESAVQPPEALPQATLSPTPPPPVSTTPAPAPPVDGSVSAPDTAALALLELLRTAPVTVLDTTRPIPAATELAATAAQLGLPLYDAPLTPGILRGELGHLTRRGGQIDVELGPLATALSDGALVVLRGRPYPKMLARWRAGYCDIPGTNASVRIAPRSRILVLPSA